MSKSTRRVTFSFDENSLESTDKLREQGRLPGGVNSALPVDRERKAIIDHLRSTKRILLAWEARAPVVSSVAGRLRELAEVEFERGHPVMGAKLAGLAGELEGAIKGDSV